MNDTQDTDQASDDADQGGFESQNLRTISEVRRSSEDRIVAGVCAGVARHLNIDPIIVRIAVVALTFIGLSGLILYLAAWFLLPEDDAEQSVAADWFNLDQNEPQFRAIGLFVAAVVAVVAIVGDSGWGLWWIGWWVLPAAFLFWLFVVRPRRRREEALVASKWSSDPEVLKTQVDEFTAWKTAEVLERKRQRVERRRESRALRRLTFSLAAIAIAITLIVDRLVGLDNSTYIAAALVAIAIGCLIGTLWGDMVGLGFLGAVLAVALALTSAVPDGRVGQQIREPQTLVGLQANYRHGIGQFELDLTEFDQPTQLVGKTVEIEAGIGQTLVFVPADLPVRLDAQLRAGEITAFGREWHGRGNDVDVTDGDGRALHLVIDQRFGEVKVIRR